MSEPDPMAAALRDLQRKGGSMATFTAALVVLMVGMLREQQQQTTAQAAVEQRAAEIRALVLKHLPEPMAQALIRSEQFPQLMDALKELQARGGDVASFLSWAGPVLTREQANTEAAASRAADAESTSSAAAASSTSTPQSQAPAVPDRAGLAERVRGAWAALTSRTSAASAAVGSAGTRAEIAELHPDQEAWAVVTAVYACGVPDAIQLVQSPVWPALAQEMLARGYAHQRGDTDRDAVQVLKAARDAMPDARGLDWPAAAAAAFTFTRQADQLHDADVHARTQAAASGPQHPAPARSVAAPTGTAPATPAMGLPQPAAAGLAPTFSHPAGSTPTTPAAAATARSSTVPADAAVKVSEHADPAAAAAQPTAPGPRLSR